MRLHVTSERSFTELNVSAIGGDQADVAATHADPDDTLLLAPKAVSGLMTVLFISVVSWTRGTNTSWLPLVSYFLQAQLWSDSSAWHSTRAATVSRNTQIIQVFTLISSRSTCFLAKISQPSSWWLERCTMACFTSVVF